MQTRVTGRDILARLEEVREAVATEPISRHPFLAVALAFGIGCAIAQAAGGHAEGGERQSVPITEKIFELLIPTLLEKALREAD